MALGSAVHAAIEQVIADQHAGQAPDHIALWANAWERRGGEVDWAGETPEMVGNVGYRLLGAAPVKATLANLRPQVIDGVLSIERRIELGVPGVGVPVIGFIDLITDDGVAVDFKTAGRAWTQQQAETETQPLVYLAALNQSGHPHTPGRFRHLVITKTRTVQVQQLDTERSMGEVMWFLGVVAEVWRAIKAGRFDRNPRNCYVYGKPCPFLKPCREGK